MDDTRINQIDNWVASNTNEEAKKGANRGKLCQICDTAKAGVTLPSASPVAVPQVDAQRHESMAGEPVQSVQTQPVLSVRPPKARHVLRQAPAKVHAAVQSSLDQRPAAAVRLHVAEGSEGVRPAGVVHHRQPLRTRLSQAVLVQIPARRPEADTSPALSQLSLSHETHLVVKVG